MAVESTRVDPPEDDPLPPSPQYATKEEIEACQAAIAETKVSLKTMLDRLQTMEQDTPAQQVAATKLSRQVQQARAHLAKLVTASRASLRSRNDADDPPSPTKKKPVDAPNGKRTPLGYPVL